MIMDSETMLGASGEPMQLGAAIKYATFDRGDGVRPNDGREVGSGFETPFSNRGETPPGSIIDSIIGASANAAYLTNFILLPIIAFCNFSQHPNCPYVYSIIPSSQTLPETCTSFREALAKSRCPIFLT